MKVLFIQNFLQAYYGIMSISAVLKKEGHGVEVHIVDKEEDMVSLMLTGRKNGIMMLVWGL